MEMDYQRIKQQFPQRWQQVEAAINHVDPVGLVHAGAKDAYDQEVAAIVMRMGAVFSDAALAKLIQSVFAAKFGEVGDAEVYESIALRISESR